MAGHSKWANIKFRKAAQDAKRGKVFTKLIREITVAARSGGGDGSTNARLRSAMDKALSANMTRDSIERAIKRGIGEHGGAEIEEITYEGYGPGGVALMVECTTDNRNRTVSEIRHAFNKHGGNLGLDGSVSYLFNRVGSIVFQLSDQIIGEEQIMDIVLTAGADDIENEEGIIEVLTPVKTFHAVLQALVKAGVKPELSELVQRPTTEVELNDEMAEKIYHLIAAFEQLDDVQEVFGNHHLANKDHI